MAIKWFQIPAGSWYGNAPGVFAHAHQYDYANGRYWVANLTGPKIGNVELGYDHCAWHDATEAMEAADEWMAEVTAQSDGRTRRP